MSDGVSPSAVSSSALAAVAAARLPAVQLSVTGLPVVRLMAKSHINPLKSSPISSTVVSPVGLLTTRPPGRTWKERMRLAAGVDFGGIQVSRSPSWVRVNRGGTVSPQMEPRTILGMPLAEEKESNASASVNTTSNVTSEKETVVDLGRAKSKFEFQDTTTADYAATACGGEFAESVMGTDSQKNIAPMDGSGNPVAAIERPRDGSRGNTR